MARKERKVVTVLFADLVGFTSRAETLDPEDVEAILQPYHARLREELEQHGGTVEKFIGDAVMAVFGAPTAHEDDPERAVRAALAIRDWAAEDGGLEVRIAVNTGEALVILDARPESGEGMVAGDVVNTAARMQAAAPVNGILVGETTFRATRGIVDYREHEPVEAKGKAEPVAVWQAVEARSRFGVDVVQESRAPLVGRTRELTLLTDAFARARAGREPQLVTLVGVPGIGKSRLVYELMQVADADPERIRWRQGRCLPYGEGVTFWALGEIVKSHAAILEDDPAERAEEKLAQIVDDPWVRSHLRPLVGLAADLGGEDRLSEAFAAWTQFFEALADEAPLVLVLEDLHWADDQLLDFVDHLVERAGDVAILVVATARPELLERRPGWGGGKPNALTLSLSPLTDDDTARLLSSLLERSVLPAETQQAVLARAGGNPLFAEQYARMLAEHGEAETVPETVQGIIAARLDALSPAEKEVLQNAAVIGKVFWAGALGAAGDILHGLERKEFVRRQRRSSVAGETEYAFRHFLLRDVAYGQIPRAERADKHRRAAEWIDALTEDRDDHVELLADHYVNALELARAAGRETAEFEDRSRSALRDAGDRASTLNAFAAAARYYEQAIALWPLDTERPELLFRLGQALFYVGDQRAADVLEEAIPALAGERAAEAEAVLSRAYWVRGQQDLCFEHRERARALVRDAAPSAAKARVLGYAAGSLMIAGKNQEAIVAGREALAIAESLGLEELRARALCDIGSARYHDGDPAGIEDLERGLEVALAANSYESPRAYNNLAVAVSGEGDLRRARRLRAEGLDVAERLGNVQFVRFLRGVQPFDLYMAGEWDEATRLADAFIAECEAGSPHYQEGPVRRLRAVIRLARDDADGALSDMRRALELAREAKDPQALAPTLGTLVWVHDELHVSSDETTGLAREFLEFVRLRPRRTPIDPFWVAAAVGMVDDAEDALGAPSEDDSIWTRATRAVLDGDFVAAADLFATMGAVSHEAYARLRARSESEVHLQKALAFYRSVGATRYIREGEALLAATA